MLAFHLLFPVVLGILPLASKILSVIHSLYSYFQAQVSPLLGVEGSHFPSVPSTSSMAGCVWMGVDVLLLVLDRSLRMPAGCKAL